MKNRKRYTKEFKAQAVELAQAGRPVPEIARDLQIGSDLLYRWIRDSTRECPAQTGQRHFKKSRSDPRDQTPAGRREMIGSIRDETGGSVRRICRVLGLPRSSYHHAASETPSRADDRKISADICEIFRLHRRRYGYRRITDELADRGIRCAPARVRRLMRESGLHSLQPKSYAPRTSDGKASAPSPNLLEGRPLPTSPNIAWAGDITHIPIEGGWAYLAVVIDLCSRRAIGWSLQDNMRSGLVTSALEQALGSRTPPGRPKFHSDRGSQYGSRLSRGKLAAAGIDQSISARANRYDNAWTESFIGTLKRELIGDGRFEDIDDARVAIFEYIEAYYNTQRKHSSIGYMTPNQFEEKVEKLTIN